MNGALVGFLGLAVAAGGGGLFWRRLRKNRRPKTTRLDPITVRLAPLAPRAHPALPPAADLPPGQDQAGLQEQAPWEQSTLVDLRWTPSPPSAGYPSPGQGGYPPAGEGGYAFPGEGGYAFPGQGEYPSPGEGGYALAGEGGYAFPGLGGYPSPGEGGYPPAGEGEYAFPGLGGYPSPGQGEYPPEGEGEYPYSQDPQQHLSQLRIQGGLPPVENPFLEGDQDRVQRPPWTPGSPPPPMPAPGQRAPQHPDQAGHPQPGAS